MGIRHEEDIRLMFENIKREGFEQLVLWLDQETDYFIAPSSTKYHCAHEGGLAEHSYNVTDLLFKKNEYLGTGFEYTTLAICGLFHDLCKVNLYKLQCEEPTGPQMKKLHELCKGKLPVFPGALNKEYVSKVIDYMLNGGDKPEYIPGKYVIEDNFPMGHGEKSVILLQRFIQLTDEELFAIRWHMGPFEGGYDGSKVNPSYQKALNKGPLTTMLFTADFEASFILEQQV